MADINSTTGVLLINDTSYIIGDGVNVIGRDPSICTVTLTNSTISKQHALIIKIKETFFVSDFKSTNSSKLEGIILVPWQCYELIHNANLTFGEVNCKFLIQDYTNLFKTPHRLSKQISVKSEKSNISIELASTSEINSKEFENDILLTTQRLESVDDSLYGETQVINCTPPDIAENVTKRTPLSNRRKKNLSSFENDGDFFIPETQADQDLKVNETNIAIDESVDFTNSQTTYLVDSSTETSKQMTTLNLDSSLDTGADLNLTSDSSKEIKTIDEIVLESKPSFNEDILNSDSENELTHSTPLPRKKFSEKYNKKSSKCTLKKKLENIHELETQLLTPASLENSSDILNLHPQKDLISNECNDRDVETTSLQEKINIFESETQYIDLESSMCKSKIYDKNVRASTSDENGVLTNKLSEEEQAEVRNIAASFEETQYEMEFLEEESIIDRNTREIDKNQSKIEINSDKVTEKIEEEDNSIHANEETQYEMEFLEESIIDSNTREIDKTQQVISDKVTEKIEQESDSKKTNNTENLIPNTNHSKGKKKLPLHKKIDIFNISTQKLNSSESSSNEQKDIFDIPTQKMEFDTINSNRNNSREKIGNFDTPTQVMECQRINSSGKSFSDNMDTFNNSTHKVQISTTSKISTDFESGDLSSTTIDKQKKVSALDLSQAIGSKVRVIGRKSPIIFSESFGSTESSEEIVRFKQKKRKPIIDSDSDNESSENKQKSIVFNNNVVNRSRLTECSVNDTNDLNLNTDNSKISCKSLKDSLDYICNSEVNMYDIATQKFDGGQKELIQDKSSLSNNSELKNHENKVSKAYEKYSLKTDVYDIPTQKFEDTHVMGKAMLSDNNNLDTDKKCSTKNRSSQEIDLYNIPTRKFEENKSEHVLSKAVPSKNNIIESVRDPIDKKSNTKNRSSQEIDVFDIPTQKFEAKKDEHVLSKTAPSKNNIIESVRDPTDKKLNTKIRSSQETDVFDIPTQKFEAKKDEHVLSKTALSKNNIIESVRDQIDKKMNNKTRSSGKVDISDMLTQKLEENKDENVLSETVPSNRNKLKSVQNHTDKESKNTNSREADIYDIPTQKFEENKNENVFSKAVSSNSNIFKTAQNHSDKKSNTKNGSSQEEDVCDMPTQKLDYVNENKGKSVLSKAVPSTSNMCESVRDHTDKKSNMKNGSSLEEDVCDMPTQKLDYVKENKGKNVLSKAVLSTSNVCESVRDHIDKKSSKISGKNIDKHPLVQTDKKFNTRSTSFEASDRNSENSSQKNVSPTPFDNKESIVDIKKSTINKKKSDSKSKPSLQHRQLHDNLKDTCKNITQNIDERCKERVTNTNKEELINEPGTSKSTKQYNKKPRRKITDDQVNDLESNGNKTNNIPIVENMSENKRPKRNVHRSVAVEEFLNNSGSKTSKLDKETKKKRDKKKSCDTVNKEDDNKSNLQNKISDSNRKVNKVVDEDNKNNLKSKQVKKIQNANVEKIVELFGEDSEVVTTDLSKTAKKEDSVKKTDQISEKSQRKRIVGKEMNQETNEKPKTQNVQENSSVKNTRKRSHKESNLPSIESEPSTSKKVKIGSSKIEPSTSQITETNSTESSDSDAKSSTAGSEISKKSTRISRTTTASTSTRIKYNVMFTLFRDEDQEQTVKKLGGKVVEKCKDAEVLVTNQIKRSVKLLSAVSLCIPVVSPRWLDVCKNTNYFVDPWNYLLKDLEAEKKFNFKLKDSLNEAKNGKILNNYTVFGTKSVPADLKEIVENSGGKYLKTYPKTGLPTSNSFIVADLKDKQQLTKIPKNILVVSAEAIFSSVIKQKLDLKSHTLV